MMKGKTLMGALLGAALLSVCGVASAQGHAGEAEVIQVASSNAKISFHMQCKVERISATKTKKVCRYTGK